MKLFIAILMVIILAIGAVLGCGEKVEEGVPFTIEVSPAQLEYAYPGQAYNFTVKVTSEETGKDVNISASIQGAVVEVSPEALKPGEVAKVVIYPADTSVGQILILHIEGERDGLIEKETATIYMGSGS